MAAYTRSIRAGNPNRAPTRATAHATTPASTATADHQCDPRARRSARSSRVRSISAERRVISAARAGVSSSASWRNRHMPVSVGMAALQPATIWRALSFLALTSDRLILMRGTVFGIRHHLLGRADNSWLGEPLDEAGNEVVYFRRRGGRSEEESEYEAEVRLPDSTVNDTPCE